MTINSNIVAGAKKVATVLLAIAALYAIIRFSQSPSWKRLETLSGAGVATAGAYATVMLAWSYWLDFTATWRSNSDAKATLTTQADNYRKISSLLPWPLGLVALLSAAGGMAVALQKVVAELP